MTSRPDFSGPQGRPGSPVLALLGLLLAFLLQGPAPEALSAPAQSEPGQTALNKALAARDDLLNSSGQRRKRHAWLEVVQSLLQAAEKYPNHKAAPEALAGAAEVALRSGRIFGIKTDFEKADQLSGLFLKRHPRHARAPGCLLVSGEALLKLGFPEKARRQLAKVESDYPKAKKEAQEARRLLAALNSGSVRRTPARAKPAPAEKTPARPAPLKSGRAQVYHLKAEKHPGGLTVTAYVDKSVPFLYNLLPPAQEGGLYRVYVDFQGSELPPGTKRQLKIDSPLGSQAKLSQFRPDTVRLVLEMPKANPYTPQMLKEPDRLVLKVAARKDDLAKIAAPSAEAGSAASRPPGAKSSSAAVNPAREGSESLARQLGLGVSKVVIDPGHGGRDSGALAGKRREKEITLKAARLLAEKLRQKGFTVVLTRSGDVYLPLERRAKIANEAKGDLLISLHVNAHQNAKINGVETYFLNLTADRGAMAVAARENASANKSLSDLNDILKTIAKNTQIAESRVLAKTAQNAVMARFRKSRYQVNDLGVKQAPFYVLIQAGMPAILVEMGFITNPTEGERLTQEAYLNLITEGLTQGILNYQKSLSGK